jgi:O-antigen/teichoic acid export membrane protein
VILAFGPTLGALIIHRPDLGGLMRIVALSGIVAVAYNVSTTALQATRRMRDLAVVENVDMILAKMLPVGPLLWGWGLPGLLWAMLAGEVLSCVFALRQYRRVAVRHHAFPDLPALARAAWQVPYRRYLRFTSIAAMDKNVAQFFAQTPVLFLSRWAGAEQVGLFGVAGKVFTLVAALQGAVSKVFSVRLSQEMGTKGPAATRRLFWRTSLFWGVAFSAASLVFLALLPVFRWIYGPDKLPSLLLVGLLAGYTAKQGFTVSLGAIFLIANRVATNALAKLPLMALALPIGVYLVQRWGAVGAAGYQLGAYLAGDVMYFAIIATPWFWRSSRSRSRA